METNHVRRSDKRQFAFVLQVAFNVRRAIRARSAANSRRNDLRSFTSARSVASSATGALDRALRARVVTPDMHRVHHSVEYNESSSNFGFNLPWWDRLFGTYRAETSAGQQAMTVGVDAFRDTQDSRLDRLLTQPFRDTPGRYPINRRQEGASLR